MICPRCMKDNVTKIGDSHYMCNDPLCVDNENNKTQFLVIEDDPVRFPYNVIFSNRNKSEFFRKPYLVLSELGSKSII